MFLQPLLHLTEQRGIGRRALVGVAHMNMRDRGAGFERLMRRFDLLRRRGRQRRIVLLAGHGAGDRDGDDDGTHGFLPRAGARDDANI